MANPETAAVADTTPSSITTTSSRDATGTGESNRNNQENRRSRQYSQNRRVAESNEFKGETAKMNGNVLQIHSERKNKSQFSDTVDALKVYSSVAYKNDIEFLNVLFTKMEKPKVDEPEDPKETEVVDDDGTVTKITSKFEEMKYTENVKQWIRDDKSLKATIRSLYNIVWGQCSKLMKNKITMAKNFSTFESKGDVTELLKEVRRVSLQIETNTSVYDAMDEAKSLYYSYKQDQNESNSKHLKNFKSIVEAIEHLGGEMFADEALIKHEESQDVKNGLNPPRSEFALKKDVREKMMAIALIKRAKFDYKKLITTIRDQHAFGIDVYPNTLHDAYELLENHSSTEKPRRDTDPRRQRENDRTSRGRGRGGQQYRSAFQFAQSDSVVPGSDGRTVARTLCFKCQKMGHFADFCPTLVEGVVQNNIAEEVERENTRAWEQSDISEADDDEKESLNEEAENSDSEDSLVVAFQYMGLSTNLSQYGKYTDTDILLDTGSTTSVFNNKKMLLNVRKSKKNLRAYSNGGSQDSNLEGDFPGMFKVWYNPSSMMNILSFKDVRKHFRITMDTDVENVINVHMKCGKVLKFEEVESGLYLLHTNNITSKKVSAYSFLTLVKSNKANFTSRQIKRSDMARNFRKFLGYPGLKYLL